VACKALVGVVWAFVGVALACRQASLEVLVCMQAWAGRMVLVVLVLAYMRAWA